MALTLPGRLVRAIHYIGYDFPQSNEDVLREWGDHLEAMAGAFDHAEEALRGAVAHLESHNEGTALEAFRAHATDGQSDIAALGRFREGTSVAAHACDYCATAVVIMKGVVLFQLGLLAASLATGPVSFTVRWGVERAIDAAVEAFINKVTGGE